MGGRSKFSLWIFLAIFSLITRAKGQTEPPEVDINSGRIRGHWEQTKSGIQYAAFTGVPYAKAPVRNKICCQNPSSVTNF